MTRVDVTYDDIQHGKQRSCFSCPVARAMTRVMKHRTTVGRHSFTVQVEPRWWSSMLPEEVTSFIIRYDSGHPVEPFTFHVEIPTEYLR